jgi:hypothetical protein
MKLTKDQLYVALGYVLFMFVFFVIGVTKARLESFIAIILLTGLYAACVKMVKKVLEGSKPGV